MMLQSGLGATKGENRSGPHLGVAQRGRPLLLLAVAVVFSVTFSFFLVNGWLAYSMGAAVALVWFSVVAGRPYLGLISLLFLTSSFISQDALPALSIGANFRPSDLVLGVMLLLILLKPVVNPAFRFVRTPLDLPLILFAMSAVVACFTATQSGIQLLQAVPEARYPLYYLVFFAVTNLVRSETSLKWLVKALFILASLTAIVIIVQAALGTSFDFMSTRSSEVNVGEQEFSGITRVLAPGSILIQCMLVAGFSVCLQERTRVSYLLFLGMISLLALAVFLSFYRTFWLSTLLSLGLAFLFASNAHKARVMLVALVIFPVFLVVASTLATFDGKVGTYAQAAFARSSSLTSGEVFVSTNDTWENRMGEAQSAIGPIMEHPIFGVGFAVPWRTAIRFQDDVGTFTHNGYVWVLVKMGLLGFIPFLLMLLVFILRGLKLWKNVAHPFFRAVALGFTLAFVGFLFANVTESSLVSNWKWTTVFGGLMGINEVIYRLYGSKAATIYRREFRVE